MKVSILFVIINTCESKLCHNPRFQGGKNIYIYIYIYTHQIEARDEIYSMESIKSLWKPPNAWL